MPRVAELLELIPHAIIKDTLQQQADEFEGGTNTGKTRAFMGTATRIGIIFAPI